MAPDTIEQSAAQVPPMDVRVPQPEEMRRAMGSFASGVTVVTAIDGDDPVGFACQSFASLSLEPPLVLICAGRTGQSWQRVRTAGTFCINVLGEDQVDLCTRFGSRNGQRFEGLAWETTNWGAPALPGALMRVHCVLEDVHDGGDHDIAVGGVLGLEVREDGRPLIFHRGRFGLDTPPAVAGVPWGFGDRWG